MKKLTKLAGDLEASVDHIKIAGLMFLVVAVDNVDKKNVQLVLEALGATQTQNLAYLSLSRKLPMTTRQFKV
jgi:hypothetical protein